MAIELNHTIVHARDKAASGRFYAEILGLPAPEPLFHFLVIRCANGVSLDIMETTEDIQPQHYAFLVSDGEFDAIFERVKQRGVAYYPGPAKRDQGQINHSFGGRGFYFEDPAGNFLEVITKPYVAT